MARRTRAGGGGVIATRRIQDLGVIADAERPVAIAGVMGGAETEITDSTVNVLVETANFTLAWSASTTTTPSGGSVESMFQQFGQLIVDSMAKDGLV